MSQSPTKKARRTVELNCKEMYADENCYQHGPTTCALCAATTLARQGWRRASDVLDELIQLIDVNDNVATICNKITTLREKYKEEE